MSQLLKEAGSRFVLTRGWRARPRRLAGRQEFPLFLEARPGAGRSDTSRCPDRYLDTHKAAHGAWHAARSVPEKRCSTSSTKIACSNGRLEKKRKKKKSSLERRSELTCCKSDSSLRRGSTKTNTWFPSLTGKPRQAKAQTHSHPA